MEDIILRYVDMPEDMHGMTVTDANNDYNIYINARIGFFAQEKAKQHELDHIRKNHLFSHNKTAVQCEKEIL